MPLIWKPQDISVYRTWVEAILEEASDELNDWESNFIQNIENQLVAGRNLTQAQAEKLDAIYTEKTK